MKQESKIIWISENPEAIRESVDQLESLTYQVSTFESIDQISDQNQCDILIISHQKNNTSAIEACLKYKNEKLSSECLTIFIASDIQLKDKESFFSMGGDHLIIEPYGFDELRSYINKYNAQAVIKSRLQSQIDEASNMALTVMENASDYGMIINFVKNAINAKNHEELSKNIFESTRVFSSSCLLEIKLVNDYEYYYSNEYLDPDIKRILQVNRSQERVVKVGDFIQINHENLVCLVEGLPIHDEDKMGRVLDGLVMLCDVADRFSHSLYIESQIRHTDESRRLFLATLGHELKTPINSILGFSKVLIGKDSNKPLGETGINALNRIVESTTTINTIINTLVEISSSSNDMKLSDKIDVDRIVLRLSSKFSNVAKKKGLHIQFNAEPDLSFNSNEKVLVNILEHLIDNAIKFTESGEVTINIRLEYPSPTEQDIVFEVEDTGIGIEPANHKRIFEEIGQLDQSHDRSYYGVGLGLYYVNQMCEQINADIQVESQLAQGAKFTLRVHINDEVPEAHQQDDVDTTFF